MIRLIAAIDRSRGIAKNGGMPWNIPEDEKFFTDQTKSLGGHVLTGGTTFREAYKSQPLADRQNYILTRNPEPIEGAVVVNDLEKFLADFKNDLWVAGGAKVFEEVIKLKKADELYLTLIDADFGCDTIFPEYSGFELIEQGERREQNGFFFSYARFGRKAT
jgi:dihydrofolate reductase